MITLQASSWIIFLKLSQVIIIPSVVYIFWRPGWAGDSITTVLCHIVQFSLGALGAIVALGHRFGFIDLQWNEESKKTLFYKMHTLADSLGSKK